MPTCHASVTRDSQRDTTVSHKKVLRSHKNNAPKEVFHTHGMVQSR